MNMITAINSGISLWWQRQTMERLDLVHGVCLSTAPSQGKGWHCRRASALQ